MSKYIDLADEIKNELIVPKADILFGIDYALSFLDDNTDQVPGRTITEGEVLRFTRNVSDRYARGVNAGLILAGVEITPDPEPTNAEKLAASIDMSSRGLVYLTEYQIAQLAKGLEEDGVKAPDHD